LFAFGFLFIHLAAGFSQFLAVFKEFALKRCCMARVSSTSFFSTSRSASDLMSLMPSVSRAALIWSVPDTMGALALLLLTGKGRAPAGWFCAAVTGFWSFDAGVVMVLDVGRMPEPSLIVMTVVFSQCSRIRVCFCIFMRRMSLKKGRIYPQDGPLTF
jgi:hypothetical protein